MNDQDTNANDGPTLGARHLFRKRADPYAGSNLPRAKRLAAILFVAGGLCATALLPAAPPTYAIGPRGWVLAGLCVLVGLLGSLRLLLAPERVSTNELLAMSYAAVGVLALLEWLAGGHSSPYHQLFVLSAVYTATVHPPRRVLPYLAVVVVAMHLPMAYENWHSSEHGDAALQTLMILGLSLLGCVTMDGVKAQRVALRVQGDEDRHAAETDQLTGLGNRRKLLADLEREAAVATHERPLLLGLYDLDGFKAYNDSFGHQAGDALLARLGARLAAAVGPHASAYRMGGDEFCMLVPAAGEDREVLLAACADALADAGSGFGVAASHGSALLPHEATEPSVALRIADGRMYARKSIGRSSAGRQTADALVRALAERNPVVGGDLDDMPALTEAVGRALSLPDDDFVALQHAAALHDVGKLAVPDAILNKRGPLDDQDWGFVRRHTLVGERILAAAPSLASAARVVRSSHERYDGGGYPDGLAGEQIPLASRVIAVCDAYKAMTSARPYRVAPKSPEGAIEEIRREAGGQFDPRVVAVFAQLVAGVGAGSALAADPGAT